eukprot:351243-Chlamydomonas_euryale.AAC.5
MEHPCTTYVLPSARAVTTMTESRTSSACSRTMACAPCSHELLERECEAVTVAMARKCVCRAQVTHPCLSIRTTGRTHPSVTAT